MLESRNHPASPEEFAMRFTRQTKIHPNTQGNSEPHRSGVRRALAIGSGVALLTSALIGTVGADIASAVGPTIPSRSTPTTKAPSTTVKRASTSGSTSKKTTAKKTTAKTTKKTTTAKKSTAKSTTKTTTKAATVRGDFGVSIQDESVIVAAGSSGTTRVFIDASDGFASPVTMSPREIPDGIDVRVFSPIRESARVDITVAEGVPDGSYAVKIRGTAGGKSRTGEFTVVVGPGGETPAAPVTDAPTTTAAIGGIARPIDPGVTTTVAGAVPGPTTIPGATAVPGATTTTIVGATIPGATTTTVRANVPTDVVINLVPATLTVAPGGTATASVVVAVSVATTGNLNMSASGLPAGVTATFAPPNLLSGLTALTIAVPATTPAGSYPFSVVATATTGGLVRTGTGTLVVGGAAAPTATVVGATTTLAPGVTTTVAAATTTIAPGAAADLNIVVATPALTVPNGGSGSINFTLTGTQSSGALVSVSGAPTQVSVSAFPNPVTSGAGSVTFFVPAGTPPGSFSIVISARSGAIVRAANATLTIA
jgi:hypothetical protein